MDEFKDGRTEVITWANGTRTEMMVAGTEVEIVDRSQRLANGVNATSRTIAETLDLAEEHSTCASLLRKAARRAYDNQQNARG